MEANILKRIFFDEHNHWERFKDKYGARIRPVVLKEIEKFRGCGDPKNGFTLFVCEGCHHVRKVPYRCKGRFCTTCSVGESEEWSRLLSGVEPASSSEVDIFEYFEYNSLINDAGSPFK
ncbi:transposase zinc-binding domain-containing protein [Bacillus cereus]|uniref:Transposase zinc-binding domain-containing protein n=1 Tax=Bacillus cereus TaxID=1396 RepID=A0AAW5L6E0_BACCE|nr:MULTISPECIES: transposase zinc-binding domain-containing protein [Bacillus cereus group]MCQ6289193.1 transposase zinc-binding domain-containing protein [Bacillus cereus]MCQ6318682.1 transposase zinc-binding domain-containing protein [Bacillus cereus]MCQ6331450.1 transposase zinc-binding domain-containing protein [Bacillus cereus]MCQ6386241.1 transposase zinc-binding domain-containing protein [Bacillus cereus]